MHRPVELAQYTSFAFTAHLLEARIDASVGTVGDALDNALMESQIGLHITELIKPRRRWHGPADVELGTAEWVDWFNNHRPTARSETRRPTNTRPTTTLNSSPNRRLESTYRASTDPGAVQGAPLTVGPTMGITRPIFIARVSSGMIVRQH
ncbi:integrase core domain-containing protein [Streptomyces sp. NBC_00076]|uniref:integrase core domain-containing protein n=1 Tax=Streptomyces sp. NBC_00076 TaxID=2975642 RepID=UPI00324CA062